MGKRKVVLPTLYFAPSFFSKKVQKVLMESKDSYCLEWPIACLYAVEAFAEHSREEMFVEKFREEPVFTSRLLRVVVEFRGNPTKLDERIFKLEKAANFDDMSLWLRRNKIRGIKIPRDAGMLQWSEIDFKLKSGVGNSESRFRDELKRRQEILKIWEANLKEYYNIFSSGKNG